MNLLFWNFYILGDFEGMSTTYDGKIWNDYLINRVDSLKTYTNNTNLDFSLIPTGLMLKLNLKNHH